MPLENTNLNFSITTIDDLMRCINLASLLEISGWPKPGNVHRTKNFKKTRYEHFLAGVAAIQPNFREFCENLFQFSFDNNENYKFVGLGAFFKAAVKEMMRWQSGGNVLLGHILILAPLAAAAVACLKTNKNCLDDFKYNLNKVINDSSVEDTINLYEAIRSCTPGGLGKIERYDVNDKNSLNEIISDKINLKKIFELSKEYDLISYEYSNGFNIVLNEGLPYFLKTFSQSKDPNIAIVNTYLKLLSKHPDTLIIRKSGMDSALFVSKSALKILEHGGISSEEGLSLAIKLDNKLQEKKGKLNPGTTADLIAGIIFCALIFGLKL